MHDLTFDDEGDIFSYDVTLAVKFMDFWETNPVCIELATYDYS